MGRSDTGSAPSSSGSVLSRELAAQVADWQRRLAGRDDRPLLPARVVEATLAQVDGLRERGARTEAGVLLDALRQLEYQHRDPGRTELLHVADCIAWEATEAVAARARAAGLPVDERAEVPAVAWMENLQAPVTWRRALHLPAPSLAGARTMCLPFQVILVPQDHLAAPWRLASVAHEVGHGIDGLFGLSARARAAVGAARLGDRRWREAWLEEVVADLVALAVAGPVFVDTLRFIVDGLGLGPDVEIGGLGHPPLDARLALLRGWWAGLGDGPVPRGTARPRRRLSPLVAEDVEALLATDLLGIRDLLPAGPGAWGALPGRALAAARRESPRGEPTGGAALEAARRVLRDGLPPLPATMGGSLAAGVRTFYAQRVPRLAPTALELTGSSLKVPPVARLAGSDALWLVGATHRSLHAQLATAFEERGRRPWDRIEVLFLGADADLAAVYAGETGDFVAVRAAARADLERDLPAWAAESFVGGPVAGALYASFFHRRATSAFDPPSWYVHTSAPVWGQSIATAPSADYRSVTPDLHGDPEITALLRGLRHLRAAAGCPLPEPAWFPPA